MEDASLVEYDTSMVTYNDPSFVKNDVSFMNMIGRDSAVVGSKST
jgi:hypothetical protein